MSNEHLPRELRDLAGDLRYCDADSLAAKLMYAAADEVERLKVRQQELLATIVRVTNETPFSDEAQDALKQRGVMLAEIGTLKARIIELEESAGFWGRAAARARSAAIDEAIATVEMHAAEYGDLDKALTILKALKKDVK